MKSNVSKIMKSKGVTLRQLREMTVRSNDPDKPNALSMATIMNARGDKKIETCNLSTLKRIARALGVSVKDLFEDEPE